jgi:hypothetical protein
VKENHLADFATLDELKARLDWTLDADEERIATSALEDASDLARGYAGRDWPDGATAPRLVRTLVLKACKRYMTNPSGYTQSRAGDETLGWNDTQGENAGTVYFTATSRSCSPRSAGASPAWSPRRSPPGTVRRPSRPAWSRSPSRKDSKPFPLFADEVEPW